MNPSPATEPGVEKLCLNSKLWHACAGPLACLPNVGTRVVYFAQGHSEQIAATTNKEVEGQIPNYPNLPAHLICQLHNITMHVDAETDGVYAQMTLQPLSSEEQKESYVPIDMGVSSKQPTNYFFKMLTASDTSTHGGFSVPRRAAEKVFPPLDFSQQPPAQELIARDLHDVEWKFKHIFRGQPKRHLLTTGWSVFVSAKRLVAGDSILFIWNEQNQLLLGIRRASKPQTVIPSVLSSDSMHIGLLAAAAHAAATNSRFTVFYNPRASPFEFVIPLMKYVKAVFHTRVSVGMRFRMLFESEESSIRRLKRPWHPGLPTDPEDGGNAFPRLHGDSALNFESSGAGPLIQQRWEPSLLGNEYGQFHAMPIPALQDIRGGEFSHHNFLNYQKPFQFLQQSSKTPSFLPQQIVQQAQPQQINHVQFQSLSENQAHCIQHQHSLHLHNEQNQKQTQHIQVYEENFMIPPIPSQQHYSHVLSPLCEKLLFSDSRTNFIVQNMLGSTYPEGSTTNLSSRLGQPTISEQNQGPWEPRFTVSKSTHFGSSGLVPSFPEKDVSVETESCTADSQNHTVFGSRINFHTLPSYVGPCSITNTIGPDVSTLPYTSSYIQNSLYGCLGESSGTLQTTGVVDPPKTMFVKVYKSGSVGRSLDISQFSNYEELREEIGHMYGIEGQLEDPFRSSWQLLFVDREEDVLLLGDDPWEQFVNSVWYIKILSPEDLQKVGKQGV